MASKHAKRVSRLDTLAAYWTLVVAWFRLLRKTSGRHEPAEGRTPVGVLIAQPARLAWPGADPEQWPAVLRSMNEDTVVMRPEVRA